MIIFLYGEDSYRSRQKLNEIIEHYKNIHKNGLSLAFFDFEEKKAEGFQFFSDLKNSISQFSMFDDKKLLIVKNIFSNKLLKEKFYEEAKNFLKSKDIIVIYEKGKVDPRDALFKLLKKEAKSQEFKLLEGPNLKSWIKKEIDVLGAKIKPEALEKFFSFAANDLWQTSNEIKKIASFRKDGEIIPQDINLLIKPKIETDIFKTIEAISQKDKKTALKLLQNHLENGDSPLYLLTMINFQFRNLLMIKNLSEKGCPCGAIASRSGLHPFVVKKGYFISQKFSFLELKKIYQKIFQVDYNIKTGKIDAETALNMVVSEI